MDIYHYFDEANYDCLLQIKSGEDETAKKDALSFAQIDALGLLVEAAGGSEEKCVEILRNMRPSEPYVDVMKLARAVARHYSGSEDVNLVSHLVGFLVASLFYAGC